MAKKRIILASLAIVLLGILYWVANHSFLNIAVSNPANSAITYRVLSQSSQKESATSTPSEHTKFTVSRGGQEILVEQNNKSYFAVVKSKGFLQTLNINAFLKPEVSRKIVGNNPGPCSNYIDSVLISYTCGGYYSDITIHSPATSSQPTYAKDNHLTNLSGFIEGTADTASGTYMLVRKASTGEGQSSGEHIVFTLNGQLSVNNTVALSDLSPNKSYTLASGEQGFLIYDDQFDEVLLYSSLQASPVKVNIDKPTTERVSANSIDSSNGEVVVLYSSGTDGTGGKSSSEVVANKNGRSTHYKFNKKAYTKAVLCGHQELCLLGGDKGLDVYDTSGAKAKLKFSVSDVSAIERISGSSNVAVLTPGGLLNLDAANKSGFLIYSAGGYKLSNLVKSGSGFIITAANGNSRPTAIRIDPSAINSDSIDKNILELQKLKQVSSASAYDHYIYIAPNAGPLSYDNTSGEYQYDSATKDAALKAINEEIDKLGINRSQYQIILTVH